MKHIIFWLSTLLILSSSVAQAQTTKEEFFSDPAHASGVYQVYKYVKSPATPAPEGYSPFYISHYGRHGSRWIHSAESYTYPQNILREAHNAKKLTALGESVFQRLDIAAKDAFKRYGDLTPLGVEEHRGIAQRMYYSFPEVFSTENGRECNIYSRSTVVPRCILSMAANNERLKELNPNIKITRDAAERFTYLNNSYKNAKSDSTYAIRNSFIKDNIDVDKFISTLFNDQAYAKKSVEDPVAFIRIMHLLAADLSNTSHLNISLLDLFSKDELFTLWQAFNMVMYYNTGPSSVNGKVAIDSSKLLLSNIIECADSAIALGTISADLRFGHDTYIIPLLALMDIEGMNIQENDPNNIYKVWSDFKVSSMAANIQLIFYRNGNPKEENFGKGSNSGERRGNSADVLVKILHCEKEVTIPVASGIAPYYKWQDVKAYYNQKLRK